MHGKLRESVKKRASLRENINVLMVGLLFLAALILADRAGLPRKWHTAVYGTVGPFGTVIAFSPSYWRRWTFWLTIVVCLAAHTLAIYGLFEYLFTANVYPGTLIWTPVALIETFAVLVAILRVERRLEHKRKGGGIVS